MNTDNDIVDITAPVAPFAGRIRQLWAYFGGDLVTVTARLVAWTFSLWTPDAKSPQFTAPAGAESTGGQTLNNQATDGLSPVVGKGQQWLVGWWRAPGGSHVWSVIGSDNFQFKSDTGADVGSISPATTCGAPFTCGGVQAYALMVGVAPHVDYHFLGMAMRKKRARM